MRRSVNKRKREGFQGEKLIVIPPHLRTQVLADPICRELYFTDIGIFPKASNHYVERAEGCHEFVMQFCFDGEGFCEHDGKRVRIQSNQYFILPPNVKHIYGTSVPQGWKVGWIHFLGNSAENFISRLNTRGFGEAHDFNFSRNWAKDFDTVIDALKLDLSYTNFAYHCCKLWPTMAELVFADRLDINKEGSSPVEKAIQYMQENVQNHLSLNEIAEVTNLSVSRFSVIFKEKIGVSPKEYHIGLKIQKACSYLSMTDWTIKEIARELSFDDPYYFSRCFKQRMEVSPLHYRRHNIL